MPPSPKPVETANEDHPPNQPREAIVRVPIRRCRTEYGNGETTEVRTLHCPVTGDTMTLEQCLRCARLVGTEADRSAVTCRLPVAPAAGQFAPRQVGEVMSRVVVCVDSELGLEELTRVFEGAPASELPVVEDGGVLLGVVSRRDLSAAKLGTNFGRYRVELDVDDLMRTTVNKLPESAPLSDAARLFVDQGLESIPIVSKDNVVVGMLSVTDLLREWLRESSSP